MSFVPFVAKDIGLDENDDLKIANGDFVIVNSDGQHVKDIVFSAKGNWRFAPLVGVDIGQFINSTGTNINARIRKKITTDLERDGYTVNEIEIKENEPIKIDAVRIK